MPQQHLEDWRGTTAKSVIEPIFAEKAILAENRRTRRSRDVSAYLPGAASIFSSRSQKDVQTSFCRSRPQNTSPILKKPMRPQKVIRLFKKPASALLKTNGRRYPVILPKTLGYNAPKSFRNSACVSIITCIFCPRSADIPGGYTCFPCAALGRHPPCFAAKKNAPFHPKEKAQIVISRLHSNRQASKSKKKERELSL